MKPNQRSGGADAVRILGVVCVVAGHVWTTPITADLFYPWHVPLFFFLTGYFWSTKRTFSAELKKRAVTLGLPYVTWLGIIGILFVAYLVATDSFQFKWLRGPLFGGVEATRPFTTFWFVSVLFFAALLYRVICRSPMWVQWVLAAAGLAISYRLGDNFAAMPLAIGSAVPCLIFIVAGRSARLLAAPGRPILLGTGLLAVGAASVTLGWSQPVNIKGGDYGTPLASVVVAIMISYGLILVFEALFARLPAAASRLATLLASAGFTVVLAHCVVLWVMDTPPTGSWLACALALVVPWALGLLALRTRASVWLTGAPRARSTEPDAVDGDIVVR
jgi:acyltransferase